MPSKDDFLYDPELGEVPNFNELPDILPEFSDTVALTIYTMPELNDDGNIPFAPSLAMLRDLDNLPIPIPETVSMTESVPPNVLLPDPSKLKDILPAPPPPLPFNNQPDFIPPPPPPLPTNLPTIPIPKQKESNSDITRNEEKPQKGFLSKIEKFGIYSSIIYNLTNDKMVYLNPIFILCFL